MKRLFEQLKFERKTETKDFNQEDNWQFFVPGVNSGVYLPATLHARIAIKKQKPGLFSFNTTKEYAEITLNDLEFEKLFEEMKKIDALRKSLTSRAE